MDIIAVLLGGGFGTRLRGVLDDRPKPMASVCGKPFLEWICLYLKKQGVSQIIIATGYLGHIIEAHFKTNPIPNLSIQCVQEDRPLGTAGGFLNAVQAWEKRNATIDPEGSRVKKPRAWFVLNGDSLLLCNLKKSAFALESDSNGAIWGLPIDDASRYGTLKYDAQANLTGFLEKRPGEGIINSGVYLLKSSMVQEFPLKSPLSFENDVFPQLIRQGLKIKVLIERAPFLDIGTPESLRAGDAFIGNHLESF